MKATAQIKAFLLSVLVLSSFVPLKAEVFTLWPFGKKDSAAGGNGTSALPVTALWSEPVNINGLDLNLELSLIATNMDECSAFLLKNYPGARFARNANMLMASIKLPDGGIRKLLFVQMPPPCPLVQFGMNLPEKMPDKFTWPAGLPLPPGATPLTCMSLSNRNSLFGHFETTQPPEQALADMKASLLANGWKAGTNESQSGLQGKGEIFTRDNPLSIMLITLSSDEEGRSTKGSVYTRPLK